jgi:murein DD-endopeptidase MepM/ murein hydrolase activator NlpD
MRANYDSAAYADDLFAYADTVAALPAPTDNVFPVYDYDPLDESYNEIEFYASETIEYPGRPFNLLDYVNSQTLIAVLLLLVFAYGALSAPSYRPTERVPQEATAVAPLAPPQNPVAPPISGDVLTFVAPYTNYRITQGLHGYSYGHMAIDLAAGRGEPVLSPINGTVTALYTDEYGNSTLLIENDVYTITMLHGDYTVQIGSTLQAGQVVGLESNKGYTMDMLGNLCYGREWCGNHTHLNVYDKRLRSNVNPLDLIIE